MRERSRGVVVTATGTDVGKTHVAAGLIRACRRAACPVAALKPVASGFDEADPGASDTAVLLAALGRPLDAAAIAALSPWRFEAPLSPDMAAALEGRTIAFEAVLATCRTSLRPDVTTVIEGIGGLMVPLAPGRTTLDLMAALGLPILLVAPTGLGAISHILTALEALKHRGLAAAALVLSETPGSTVPLAAMRETLAGFYDSDALFVLERAEAGQATVFDAILKRLGLAASAAPR